MSKTAAEFVFLNAAEFVKHLVSGIFLRKKGTALRRFGMTIFIGRHFYAASAAIGSAIITAFAAEGPLVGHGAERLCAKCREALGGLRGRLRGIAFICRGMGIVSA